MDLENDVDESPHFTYIWTIKDMCSHCYVKSPPYTVRKMEMTKWFLSVFCYNASEHIELQINRENGDGPQSIQIKFELSLLGDDGLPLIKKEGIEKFENLDYFIFKKFADKHDVLFRRRAEFLPSDELTIRCQMWRVKTVISEIDSWFARTLLTPNRRSFVWAVRNFSTINETQERKLLLNTTSTQQLTFSIFTSENDGKEYVSIGVQDTGDRLHNRCSISICLLDFEGKVSLFKEESLYRFGNPDIHFKNFVEKGRLLPSLLPNDVLTLRCEVEMEAKVVWSVIENYRYLNWIGEDIIMTDGGKVLLCEQDGISRAGTSFKAAMKNLLKKGILSDVSLRLRSHSFPAHKSILSARSLVFNTIFNEDPKETSSCVEISDLTEDTMTELLYYIYTDTIGELQWKAVVDLYRAADKYQLMDLKKRCASFLKSDLSLTSVFAVLRVADMHHDLELKEAAQDFMVRQGRKFFTSDTWRDFKEQNSKLALDVVEKILRIRSRQ